MNSSFKMIYKQKAKCSQYFQGVYCEAMLFFHLHIENDVAYFHFF